MIDAHTLKALIVKPLLVQHSLSLSLKKNPAIRRKVNDIEDLVKARSEGRFAMPQVIPVPDDLDPSVPRLIFVSKAGFSQLLISQIGVVFNVRYSPDWGSTPKKCEDYLRSKVELLFKIAEVGWEEFAKPLFSGVTTTFRIPTKDQQDAVSRLAPSFSNAAMLAAQANELSYRWSLNVGELYYDNIAISSQVNLKAQASANADGIPRFSAENIEAYGIEVAGDYNDRLAYNTNEHYRTSIEIMQHMIGEGCRKASDFAQKFSNG